MLRPGILPPGNPPEKTQCAVLPRFPGVEKVASDDEDVKLTRVTYTSTWSYIICLQEVQTQDLTWTLYGKI